MDNKKRRATKKPSAEEDTFRLHMDRMDSNLHRIRALFGDATLTKDQRRKLIAEELVLLQETNKSAMRVVFDI